MQNFTLGKKGISMLLFGLVLLTTSFSSFGQENCPTVSNTSPDDFCYLSRVSDLTGDTGTTISSGTIAWYRTLTSTNPIPNDELLQDETYYAGNLAKTCTARTAVSVTVDDFGAPDPLFGAVFSPCVYGAEPAVGDPDPIYIKTVQDLIDNIEGNNVEIFDEQYGEVKLDESTALVRGENYFAGQRNPSTGCTTSRVAIRYDPIYSPAPAADPIQIVCEGSTLDDLEATATTTPTTLSQGFRWYSTNDSQPALSNSTVLIEGEDYYVSQIVNRIGRNEPPCESTDRVKVTVEFDDIDAGEPNSETYCKSEFDVQLAVPSSTLGRSRFEELFLQLLDAGVPQDGTFDPLPIDDNSAPHTYTTTYTVTSTPLGCEDSVVLTIEVTEDPTTGGNISEQACRNTFPETVTAPQVEGFFRGLVAQANGEAGGTFANDNMATIASDFNLNNTYPATFTSEYTIREGTACEETSIVSIEILESPDAGAANSKTYCDAEIQNEFAAPSSKTFKNLFEELLEFGVSPDGDFDSTADNYTGPGTYISTYTITLPNGCPDSSIITIVVNDPSAGNDVNEVACRNQLPATVTSAQVEAFFRGLVDGGDSGGTFSNIGAITADFNSNNTFPVTYSTTYTVSEGTACEDSAVLSVIVNGSPDAGADNSKTYCGAEIQNEFDNGKTFEDLFEELLESGVSGGTFNPTPVYSGPDTYQSTYSITANGCTDSAVITIVVNDQQAGEANLDNEACRNELPQTVTRAQVEGFFRNFLSNDANPDGTFSNMDLDAITADFNSNNTYPKTYNTTYTVGEGTVCEDTANLEVTILEDPNAGSDVSQSFCITEIQALIQNPQDAIDLFNSLLGGSVDTGGTFDPTLNALAAQYLSEPIGTFSTTYTVDNGTCQDSAVITVIVTDREDANAGDDVDLTFCTTDADQNLTDFLTSGANPNGTFDGYPNGVFSPATVGAGTYIFDYTVDETSGDCIDGSDSSTFTVVVNQGISAGADKSRTLCRAQINAIVSEGTARNYYLGLLDAGVPRDGTFDPTIQSLVDRYNNGEKIGTYTSFYTVGNSSCSDKAEISVTVIANSVANAGVGAVLDFCSTEDEKNLFDFLSTGADTTGSFAGFADGLFNPVDHVGPNTIIYTVSTAGSPCTTGSATATFTITVTAPVDANAGGNQTPPAYCITKDDDISLSSLLGDGANPSGSFMTPYEDGLFNPSEAGVGEFDIIYTVNGAENCAIGTATATITITVNAVPEAPVAANQSFCLVNNNTVADLVASGEDGWFASEDPEETPLPLDTVLENEKVYFAGAGSGTCRTFTAVTVTITDTDSPTLPTGDNEFCRSDNPTIQDLQDNLNGSGIRIYSSLTGGTAIATTTALQDGVQYFATATNATSGCESSERRAIRVEVNFCGIPEGFSPNGDNINDRFVIPDIAINYPNYNIEIYNRWGNMVFKGNASTPDWDGISNKSGTLGDGVLPVGVYFYILNYNDGATASEQGKLYLSR